MTWGWAKRRLSRSVSRDSLRVLLELFVLTGFAIAQPVLDVTGAAPDFFLFLRASRIDMVLLVVVVSAVPTLVLVVVELVARLAGERVRGLVHLAIVAGLFALIALQALKKLLPVQGGLLLLLALLAAAAFGLLYQRRDWVRTWLRYLAPAPLVFALLFVTTSPSGQLLRPARLPVASGATGSPDAAASQAQRPPVVVVFFDEFPLQSLLNSAGQVDSRVYPNFANFAAHSTWYRNATGVSGQTQWAVPAMLSGRYPSKILAPTAREYPDNLFTLLAPSYRLKVNEVVTQLCPSGRCGGTGAGTDERASATTILSDVTRLYGQEISPYKLGIDPAASTGRPAASSASATVPALAQVQRWAAFLDSIRRDDPQPTLYFEHVLLPHGPWNYLPDGMAYPAASYGLKLQQTQYMHGVQDVNHERHLLQVAYVDSLVGQLVQRLKQQGLWDRSLVVLTADHGNGFSVGETARTLGNDNAASLMWVPVLIKAPQQARGRIDDRNWEQVDLLPTLADMIHVPVPWPVDGFSETGPPRREAVQKAWYDIPGIRRIRDGPADFKRVLGGVTDTLVHGEDGPRGLYRYGATGSWIDQPPQAVGHLTDPDPADTAATAALANWTAATTVDPSSGQVPALLIGQFSSDPAASALVVALNGRIAAVASLFADQPGGAATKFAAIVPDALLHPGPAVPQLQLYLVRDDDGQKQLQPVALADQG